MIKNTPCIPAMCALALMACTGTYSATNGTDDADTDADMDTDSVGDIAGDPDSEAGADMATDTGMDPDEGVDTTSDPTTDTVADPDAVTDPDMEPDPLPEVVADPEPEPDPVEEVVPGDFAGVTWLHTNVSGWPETADLSSVTVGDSQICLDYDKADVWPGVDHVGAFVNANPWIFIFHEGHWWAATWEWMRHGQTCKNRSAVAGDHIKQDPFWDFAPESGTWYGFMVSGLARDGTRNAEERSNVVMVQWP